jgi:glycolate oxidase
VGPDVLDVSRSIKAALDPMGLLNPGAVLPLDDPDEAGDRA